MSGDRRDGCVLFDLDGTLLDTPGAIAGALAAIVSAKSQRSVTPDLARPLIGLPLEEMVQRLAPHSDPDLVSAMVADYREHFRRIIVPSARSLRFDGVEAGLEQLTAHGLSLAIVTSKVHSSARAIIEAAGLDHFFTVIVGADDVARPKPQPDQALYAAAALSFDASAAVVVGDSVHDIEMAERAGMQSVGVDYGVNDADQLRAAGADLVVSTFDAVVDRLLELTRSDHQEYA